jgi:LuxR family maltose regulon positive regulatory protein
MNSTLLKTKLYRPPIRPEVVSRPNLMRRLDEGINDKLTVVSAPAGYGKTTLVSAWCSECQVPVAWLSLEGEDNDLPRFLSYVITALRTIKADLGQEILSVLQSARPPAVLNLLPVLVNQLDDIQTRFVLVLDDYHVIISEEIHEAINFIIDHQPPQMHLLLTTRVDPPLPLARLRGRGQLTELRQDDLRFSEEETVAFLKRGSGIELTAGDVEILLSRTEGWIAGLQMAALSMRNKSDIPSFIEGFGGSHDYIVDYFTSEILNNLPELTRSFLLKTSFLDQLCGSLCDEVTWLSGGQQTLQRLQEENLFLVPLDDDHIWYRYHQLFADLLHKSLKNQYSSEVPELHLRASRWFEKNAYPHQAVEHAFLAEDSSRAADLLEAIAESTLGQGEHLWFLNEIEKLPQDQMELHLRLSVLRAAIFTSIGSLQRAENALRKIELHLSTHPESKAIEEYAIRRVAALRAMIAIQRGDAVSAKREAQLALEMLPEGKEQEVTWHAELLLTLSLSNFALGDLDEARQNLDRAIEQARLAGDPYTFLIVTAYLVDVLCSQGLLKEAAERCQAGLEFITKHRLDWAPVSGEMFIRWGLLLCERRDLAQAGDFLDRGMDLIRSGGVPWALAWAYHMKIFYLIAQGDLMAAEATVREADQILQLSELPARVVSGISALKTLVWIRLGKLDEAEHHLKKRGIWIDSPIRYPFHREYQSLITLLIAKDDLASTEGLLENLVTWAETAKQFRSLIGARVLQALVYSGRRDMGRALQYLSMAMDLAKPEGYLQAILEVGRPIIPLLYAANQKGMHPGFTTRLLEGFIEINPDQWATPHEQNRQPEILAALRPREIEVLRLVAEGQTNKEIALKLSISLRTVKFHMTSILTKLGVDNRMQAVTKAKSLGIIQ